MIFPSSPREVVVTLATAASFVVGANTLMKSALLDASPPLAEGIEIGAPFALTNHRGESVTDVTFAGRHMLIYFGYSFCPDLCPTSLQTMAAAYDMLPVDEREKVWPIFITIDPERDTVDVIAEYVSLFHDDMIGLTGSTEEIASVADAYRVYRAKNRVDNEADGYFVDHSSFYYVMGPNGSYVAHFGYDATEEEIAEGVSELIQKEEGA